MMADFVKQMASWNCDIKPYVVIGTITADQYKEFTGQDYAAQECFYFGKKEAMRVGTALFFWINLD